MGRGNCVSLDTLTANKDFNNISIELEIWRMWSFFFHLSSHRLGMGHVVTTLAPTFLMESSSFFQVTIKMHASFDKFKFRPDTTTDAGVRKIDV